MKKLIRKVATVAVIAVSSLAFGGCAMMGGSGGLSGLGTVARNTCRQPAAMPVYTKGAVSHHYNK